MAISEYVIRPKNDLRKLRKLRLTNPNLKFLPDLFIGRQWL